MPFQHPESLKTETDVYILVFLKPGGAGFDETEIHNLLTYLKPHSFEKLLEHDHYDYHKQKPFENRKSLKASL